MQFSTSLFGLALGVLVLYLVRRNYLYLMHGLLWIFVALAAIFLGAWPGLIDTLAASLGFSHPPVLLLLLCCMVLFVKALHADMLCAHLERDVRLLNQRLALLELAQKEAAAAVSDSAKQDS